MSAPPAMTTHHPLPRLSDCYRASQHLGEARPHSDLLPDSLGAQQAGRLVDT